MLPSRFQGRLMDRRMGGGYKAQLPIETMLARSSQRCRLHLLEGSVW
jgi:hypothetical protein